MYSGIFVCRPSTGHLLRVTVDSNADFKEVTLNYFCRRFSVVEVRKVTCSSERSIVPFQWSACGEMSISLQVGSSYEVTCDGDADADNNIPLVVDMQIPQSGVPPIIYRISAMDNILPIIGVSEIVTFVLERFYVHRQVQSVINRNNP